MLGEIATFILLSKRSRHVNQPIKLLQAECSPFGPFSIWTFLRVIFNLHTFIVEGLLVLFIVFPFSCYLPHGFYSYSSCSCTPSSFSHLTAFIPSAHQSHNNPCIKILHYNLNNLLPNFIAFIHHGSLSGHRSPWMSFQGLLIQMLEADRESSLGQVCDETRSTWLLTLPQQACQLPARKSTSNLND